MGDTVAFTRRGFLGAGLTLVSTVGTAPTFLQHMGTALAADVDGSRVASRPGSKDDHILVVVQLSGGNDGLNTLVPYGQREYYRARPTLAVSDKDVLPVDSRAGLGLHPSLAPVLSLMQAGRGSVVMGVGYPNPNRSHFASMDVWHSGDTRGGRGTGWLGAALDELKAGQSGALDAAACVCIGEEAPMAAAGRTVKPVAFQKASLFRWMGGDLNPKLGPAYDRFNRAGVLNDEGAAPAGSQASFVLRTAMDAQVASDRIRAAVAAGPVTRFPNSGLANQLRDVAAMIRAGLPTRVYYVAMGGFDTHANQAYPHGTNLRDFAQAIEAFQKEMDALGQNRRVLTMAFSEFGRRVAQNASNGTDHGAAGPMFLFGDPVRPGLLGEMPSLTDLDDGDLIYTVDFRCIYATVIEQWLGADSAKVLGQPYRQADVLKV